MATNNMPKFLEDYVTVNELIKKMNEVYPRGRMISEIEYYRVCKTTQVGA